MPPANLKRVLALFLAVFAAYLPAAVGGFILDDDLLLTANPAVVSPGASLLRLFVLSPGADYFPLTFASLWVEWRLWGSHASGYHLVNIGLHFWSVFLAWRLLERLPVRGAFWAAMLFAVHPVNVASVAWIAERKNVLALPLYLLSTLWFLRAGDPLPRGTSSRYQALSVGAFLLGLLAKPSGATLPLVLLACLWWQRRRVDHGDVARVAPHFFLAAIFAAVTVSSQASLAMGEVASAETAVHRLAVAAAAIWFYAGKAIFPVALNFFYPRWELADAWLVIPGLALVAVFTATWWRRSNFGRPLLFGFGTFVLLLLPVLGFFKMFYRRFSFVADHLQHMALLAMSALAAAAAVTALDRAPPRWRRPLGALGLGLLAALGAATAQRADIFSGAETLYRDTLAKNPGAGVVHSALGVVLVQSNRRQEAMEHFRAAIQIDPRDPLPYNNAGVLDAQAGRLEEAIRSFTEAARLEPRDANARRNLMSASRALADQKRPGHRRNIVAEPAAANPAPSDANPAARPGRIDGQFAPPQSP